MFSKIKRCVAGALIGACVFGFAGCENAVTTFNPNGTVNDSTSKVEETTTEPVTEYVPEFNEEAQDEAEKLLNQSGYSFDPNKRLGKDSNGNYVEKKCVNPFCGCVDCKCNPCDCDDM